MRDLIVVAAIILLVVMFFVVRSKVKNDEVSIQTNSSETNQRTGELGESSQGSKDSVDVRSGTSSADSPESNKANGNGKQPGSENFPSDGGPGNSNGTPPSQTESERPSGDEDIIPVTTEDSPKEISTQEQKIWDAATLAVRKYVKNRQGIMFLSASSSRSSIKSVGRNRWKVTGYFHRGSETDETFFKCIVEMKEGEGGGYQAQLPKF